MMIDGTDEPRSSGFANRRPLASQTRRPPARLPLPPAPAPPASFSWSLSDNEIPSAADERPALSSSPPRFVCTRFLLFLLPPSSSSSARRHRLHDYALAFLGPRIVLLVGRVYQRVALLVLFHVLPHPAENKKRCISMLCMYVCTYVYVSHNAEIAAQQRCVATSAAACLRT